MKFSSRLCLISLLFPLFPHFSSVLTFSVPISQSPFLSASQRLKSTKLGIKLKGGEGTNYIHGDPGIFVTNVRPGSIADGKLFPGDRIVMVYENISFP